MNEEDIIFDFGFTAVNAVDETEFNTQVEDAASYKERLDKMYESVLPLLNNLKANPSKDFIYWPNRTDKIEEFEARLKSIKDGEM